MVHLYVGEGVVVHLYVVCRWIPRLESSCRCVVELTALKSTVSGLRAERYSRDNESHETQLTKVGLQCCSRCLITTFTAVLLPW